MNRNLTNLLFITLITLAAVINAFAQAPTITWQPQNQGVIEGQTATFALTAKSDTSIDTLHYQWYKNAATIVGATNSSYTTSATTTGDNGAKFYCVVSNNNGSVNTDTVKLYVTGSSNRVTSSQVATFDFKEKSGTTVHDVSGISPSDDIIISNSGNVKWSTNGLTVRNPDYIYSNNNDTKLVDSCNSTNELTIETWIIPGNLSQNDSYILSFQSSNDYRNFTLIQNGTQFAVKVRATPGTNLYGEPYISTPNYTVKQRLMQVVYTRDATGKIKIYADGTLVASDSIAGTFDDWSSTSKLGLSGNNPSGKNWLGTYFYTDIYNRALSAAEVSQNYDIGVTVDKVPIIVFQPADTSIIEGKTAKFSVTATGIEALTYQWQKNDVNIPGATGSSYTTPALSASDNNTKYRVIVSTSYGNTTSKEAKVNVTASSSRVTAGIQVLYNFQDNGGNIVHDVSGVGTPVNLTINTPSVVQWKPYGLEIKGQSSINSVTAPTSLYDSLSNTDQITIETWIKSSLVGWIVTSSVDSANRNFLLYSLHDRNYYGRLRTSQTDNRGIPFVNTSGGPVDSNLIDLVYTFNGNDGVAHLYINGSLEASKYIGGDFSNWNKNYLLGIANEISGDFHWEGLLNLAAIYDRALTPDEIAHNYAMGPVGSISIKAPGQLNAQANAPHKIALSWADSSNNEDGFIVERKEVSPSPSSYAVLDSTSANSTNFIDSTVADTTTYSYRIRAYNLLAVSNYSNEASAKSILSTLSAPTNLTLTRNTPDTTQIKLSWVDNSTNEFGFVIQRKTGDTTSSASFNNIDTTAVNQTTFVDTSLGDTTVYTYRVYAYNQFSNSVYTNKAQIKSVLITVAKPTSFEAVKKMPDSNHVVLTWTDNSSNENGFILQRKSGDSTNTNSFANIDTLAANSTSFADTTTQDSSTYTYRIYAFNSFHKSSYSKLVQITTAGIITGIRELSQIPKNYSLYQNYPNPFNPTTRIRFDLPSTAKVTVTIYNTLGQEVARLLNRDLNAGTHEVDFNASNLSSGIYFYRIVANGVNGKNFISTKRMLLLK